MGQLKRRVTVIVVFLMIANFIIGLIISVSGIINNTYFDDLKNYKSLKNTNKYMEIDTLILKRAYDYTYTNNSPSTLVIYGELLNNSSEIEIPIGNDKYIKYNASRIPVLKSKLTNTYFLKNAPVGYYKRQYRSFLMTMYLKFSFLLLFVLALYLYIKYRNSI